MKRLYTILIVMILLIAVPIETFAVSKPAQIKNLKASAKTSVSITMKWRKAKGAKGYEVQQYDTKAKKWKALKKVTALNYKHTKLKANTLYKYRVRAYTTYKQYYNTKTKKWVNKKPAANAWKTKKSRTVYVYGKVSSVLTVRTSKASTTPQPAKPAHNHSWSDWQVTTEPTTTSTGVKTRRCSCGATETQTIPKLSAYTYDIKFVNEPYGNGGGALLYIETNNLNRYSFVIGVKDEYGNRVDWDSYFGPTPITTWKDKYDDLKNITYDTSGKYFVMVPATKGGKLTYTIYEKQDDGTRNEVYSKTANVNDYNYCKQVWKQAVIDHARNELKKQGIENPSNKEIMQEICSYIFSTYKYPKIRDLSGSGTSDIFLLADIGIPFWVSKELDSAQTPNIICEFGNALNYPLENLSTKYPRGSAEWQIYHMQAYSEQDDTYFNACPFSQTGLIDISTIETFDPETYPFWGE